MPKSNRHRDEYIRKGIHILFTSCILLICTVPKHTAYSLLGLSFTGMFLYELLRHKSPTVKAMLHAIGLHHILREHEESTLTGASYVVIATIICYLFFPTHTFILSLLTLGWSDSIAALIGRHYGSPNRHGKSIEGSTACLISSLCLSVMTCYIWKISIVPGIFAAFSATAAERYSARIGIDDNLSIPLAYAITFEILNHTQSITQYMQVFFYH